MTTEESKKLCTPLNDGSYFSPLPKLEEELIKGTVHHEVYLGNLRRSKSFKVLPHGHIVMLDSDPFNQLKCDTENNFIYVRMLRKIIKATKRILPVCLRCNDVGKAEAIIFGSSHILPDDTIEKELKHCKHEAVSQLLYEYQKVVEVEKNVKKCAVLKNTTKIHIAACHDGKSFATIVCRIGRQGTKGKCWSCKGARCGHETRWNKELKSLVLKTDVDNNSKDEMSSSSDNDDDGDSVSEQSNEKEERIERSQLKFPTTESTQTLFRQFESGYYDDKDVFVDENIQGQKCLEHGNEWSDDDPVENGWWFSNNIKISHTSFVRQKERTIYYRKTETCDCIKLYEGDEDFLIRIGGSGESKHQTKSVHLISYSLLLDFTLQFLHNGQTMNSFYHAHSAKCKFKFGMEESNIMTLNSWKKAVQIFWQEVLKLDLKKLFTCENCGNLPSTLVLDGIALGVQIKKVKAFKEKMQFVLGRESERTLSGTKFEDRSFIKLKSNKEILKESVENKMWPIKNKQIGGRAQKADSGMQKFWQMIEKQDKTLPVSDGLLLLMTNLSTSTSTTNLFQVIIVIFKSFKLSLLASQDALEMMLFTQSVIQSALADLTDVTLLSEDAFERLD